MTKYLEFLKTIVLKFATPLLLLVVLFSTPGCEKEESCSDEFCMFANFEDFYKTGPFINEYLGSLPKDWSDEQKIQALTEWLNSMPCIISAGFGTMWTYSGIVTKGIKPPPMGKIVIQLKDSGMIKELILHIDCSFPDCFWLYSCPSHQLIATGYEYVTGVAVRFQENTKIDKVFDFINLFDHEAVEMATGEYISAISFSNDNVWYILDGIKVKPYSNGRPYGNIDRYGNSGGISIGPLIFHTMHNVEYQADWLKSMTDYQLSEPAYCTHSVIFKMLNGDEKEWEIKFKEYELVMATFLVYEFRKM